MEMEPFFFCFEICMIYYLNSIIRSPDIEKVAVSLLNLPLCQQADRTATVLFLYNKYREINQDLQVCAYEKNR